jgi:Domain of unknown function (DUF4168)
MPMKTSLAAAAAALALGTALPAFAQETQAPAQSDGAGAAATESAAYSDDKLQAFAEAAVEVGGIQQDATVQLQDAQDEAAQSAVVEQANADMVAVIEATDGISVPEYMEIAEAAQVDETLRSRIEEIIVASQSQ